MHSEALCNRTGECSIIINRSRYSRNEIAVFISLICSQRCANTCHFHKNRSNFRKKKNDSQEINHLMEWRGTGSSATMPTATTVTVTHWKSSSIHSPVTFANCPRELSIAISILPTTPTTHIDSKCSHDAHCCWTFHCAVSTFSQFTIPN